VAGGRNADGVLAKAMLFDASSGTWTATGSMSGGRNDHTATSLADGRVLVVGGFNSAGGIASPEL
jgi:hypothetical protein